MCSAHRMKGLSGVRAESRRPSAVSPLGCVSLGPASLVAASIAALATVTGASGCIGPVTPAGRVQQAVQDLNQATRFGRVDIALEQVNDAYRPDFTAHHADWGSRVRILDYELVGMTMKGRDRAQALVTVGWQRVDETEMRVTELRQTWGSHGHGWLLEAEERTGGDVGLWGEPGVERAPAAPRPAAQFRSLTIR